MVQDDENKQVNLTKFYNVNSDFHTVYSRESQTANILSPVIPVDESNQFWCGN